MKIAVDEGLLAKASALGPLLREAAGRAEQERRLAEGVVAALEAAGLTRMFLPRALGGLEVEPLTYLRVMEEIASFDSVAAWLLMVSNSGAWFCARLPRATVEELFREPARSIIATAFQPPVAAREVAGGFLLTGRRPFASGIHAARWLCLTGLLMDGDQPRVRAGTPELISAIMPVEDVQVVDTWDGLGLRGSDSNDVAVQELFVPAARTCPLVPGFEPNAHYRGALYRLPAMATLVLASIPPIAVAVARNAIEEVRRLSAKRVPLASQVALRDKGAAQARLGRAEAMLRAARTLMYDSMGHAWQRAEASEQPSLAQRADLLLAATHAVQTSAEVTAEMFTSGGSSAVFTRCPLERWFRDAQVMRQHGFVCSARYETVAQVALGLEPDLPFVHF